MPSRLIYIPIEPYQSRYTQYNSVKDGVYETEFKRLGINFLAIRPDNELRIIKQGQVLDVLGRTQWGFVQHYNLVKMICDGDIDPQEDAIFYEDFWTPGFEQLMYACSSKFGPAKRDHPKIYSFIHADTLDVNDFSYKWAWWMRPLEQVWWDYQHRIFCAAREMYTPAAKAGFALTDGPVFKLNAVGHAFNKDVMLRVAKCFNALPLYKDREKRVIFASRFDSEKNPEFFMDLVEEIYKERHDISFSICTGQSKLSSTSEGSIERLKELISKSKINVYTGMTKHEYYTLLRKSKVLFNCAIQDWISYVALDATINGCAPCFPHWLTFPDVFENDPRFLYENMNLKEAKKKLYALVDTEEDISLDFVYKKYEDSVKRMCKLMKFAV